MKERYKKYQENATRNKYPVVVYSEWVRTDKTGKKIAGITGESPNETATKIAKRRMNKILSNMEKMNILSKKLNDDQKIKILTALEDAVNEIKLIYGRTEQTKEKVSFEL